MRRDAVLGEYMKYERFSKLWQGYCVSGGDKDSLLRKTVDDD